MQQYSFFDGVVNTDADAIKKSKLRKQYNNFNQNSQGYAGTSQAYDGGASPGGFGDWLGTFKDNLFAPGFGEGFGEFTDKLAKPQFGWNKGSGLSGWGMNLGKGINIANGLYQGYNALQGIDDFSDARAQTSDIVSDIINASSSNPMLQYDLTSDQIDLLRQLRRGTYDDSADVSDVDLLGALGGAAKSGITGFLGGGIPGAVIGAIGGGANSVIDNLGQAQDRTNAELEALYQAVLESERQQKNLKKQRAYASLAGGGF